MAAPSILSSTFLPPATVFLILATIPVLITLGSGRMAGRGWVLQLILVITAGVAAARTLFGTYDFGYSIYYNGPVILSFLLFISWFAFPPELDANLEKFAQKGAQRKSAAEGSEGARRRLGALLRRPGVILPFIPLLMLYFCRSLTK